MKCIKTIRKYAMHKVGDIVRVDDDLARERVLEGSWIYVPKIEWKNQGKTQQEIDKPTTSTETQVKVKKGKSKKELKAEKKMNK